MASHVRFLCGQEYVEEKVFDRALRLLRNFRHWQRIRLRNELSYTEEEPPIIDTNPLRPLRLLGTRRDVMMRPMLRLLQQLPDRKSTDPRDRVLALIGLSSDADTLGLRIDYRESTAELYHNLACSLLRHEYLHMLSSCSGSSNFDLPSWVPDWTSPRKCIPLQQWSKDASTSSILQPSFSASGGRQQPELIRVEQTSSREVRLHVALLGKIEHVGQPWTGNGLAQWMGSFKNVLESLPSPSNLQSPRKALWRVAAADQDIWRQAYKPRMSDETLQKLESEIRDHDIASLDSKSLAAAGLGHYEVQVNSVGPGRRPLLISNAVFGLGPAGAEANDVVAIILGANVAHVLRPVDSAGHYRLIGEAYVDGWMDGQAFEADLPSVVLTLL